MKRFARALIVAGGLLLAASFVLPRPERKPSCIALVGSATLLLLNVGGAVGLCRLSAMSWGYLLGATGALLILVAAAVEMLGKVDPRQSGSTSLRPGNATNA